MGNSSEDIRYQPSYLTSEDLKRIEDELSAREVVIARLTRDLAAARAEIERLRGALEYIAHFDDAHMQTAKTLHYDMRGKARATIATPADAESSSLVLEAGTVVKLRWDGKKYVYLSAERNATNANSPGDSGTGEPRAD